MRLRVQPLRWGYLPKEGKQWEECEDAWGFNEAAQRLALADGASAAFESRLWAPALVQAFVREPPSPDAESILCWLKSPIRSWRNEIHWDRLNLYQAEKARRGAFSTLLGVSFDWPTSDLTEEGGTSAQWRAVAVGDTCLFQVREGTVIVRFPVERAADFGNTPPLLSTRQDYNRHSLEELRICEGACQPGDLLVLATDALAKWFLQQVEEGEQPWSKWTKLTLGKLLKLVQYLRQERAIRNDDVALVLGWVEEEVRESTLTATDVLRGNES